MVPTATSNPATANKYQLPGCQRDHHPAIIKTPAPNGRILVACQDRPNFSLANASTYPSSYNPTQTGVLQAGDVVYADDDPTVCFGSGDDMCMAFTETAVLMGHGFLLATNGVNGYVGTSSGSFGADGSPNLGAPNKLSCIHADISPFSNLQVGIPTGDPNVGSNWNWQDCLTTPGGATIPSNGLQNYANALKFIDTDGAGATYWFAATGGNILKSSDFGRTFTRYRPLLALPAAEQQQFALALCSRFFQSASICRWVGFRPSVFRRRSAIFNGRSHIHFCIKHGLCGGAFRYWQNQTRRLSGFPAVFMSGQLVGGGEPGVFRCDNFDGAQTWNRLDNIRKVSLLTTSPQSAVDPDVYGHVMVGSPAGYVDGTIS